MNDFMIRIVRATLLKGLDSAKKLREFAWGCGFEVGDEVITADGRRGVIESFCKCDICKERFFYEPKVKTTLGEDIYITAADKENGFKYFYKIGNKLFGNLDKQGILDSIDRRKEEVRLAEEEISALWKQYCLVDMLMNTNGG